LDDGTAGGEDWGDCGLYGWYELVVVGDCELVLSGLLRGLGSKLDISCDSGGAYGIKVGGDTGLAGRWASLSGAG